MPNEAVTGLPGIKTERAGGMRRVRKSNQGVLYLEGGRVINGSLSRDSANAIVDVDTLRAGLLMGKITSGAKWRPSIIGKSNAAYVDNDTTIQTNLATATEVARLKAVGGGGNLSLKFVGPPTAAGTVAATAITVTAVTLNGATSLLTVGDLNLGKVTDSLIMPADGAETPLAIVDDGWGIKVTDQDGISQDSQWDLPLAGGSLDESQIINWPADTSTIAYLKALLNSVSNGSFMFDTAFI